MKRCKRCGETKPKREFHKNSRAKDKLQGYCIPCNIEQNRAWLDACEEHMQMAAATSRRKQKRKPEQARAHYLTRQLIKKGFLKRQPCEVCGKPDAHAHHDDYSRWWQVRWFCNHHHMEYHRIVRGWNK